MESLLLTFASCLIAIFLIIEFFIKKRVNNMETKIYSKLLITNLLFSLFAIFAYVYAKKIGTNIGINITQKTYLFIIIILAHYILQYNISIAIYNNITRKKINIYLYILLLISGILIFISNINIINKGLILDAYGTSYNIFITFLFIYVILIILTTMYIFINNKNNFKKDLPFIILIVLYVIGFIIRNSFPYIVFETFFFTFSLLIMYFTIENPDLKILNEYIKNKELVESTIEEKSNILFKISQEVRVPLKKINLLCNNIIKNENVLKIHENARNITNIANDISTIINDILDISIIDKKNIKIFESTYNIYNLFNQIVLFGNKNKNKVNFKYSISNNIPEHLYGDSSRIKQIICSILSNSFKNTEKGYVDIDIYSIIKYDICRLVITINDNRKEMSLDYINNILDNQKIITNNEIEKFNNLNLDLKLVKKLIDLQSGSLIISSNKNSTKFTIVIDQIIDTNNNENYIKKLASQLSNKLKILLIDDDYKELELFSKELKKNNVEVISTMDAKDCMDRLLNNETFDYILIDDEMENKNAVSIINEIKKQNIKTPNVIIMLDKNKESIKEHYLEDYPFSDYLLKRIYIEEIKRIIKQKNN